MFHAFLLECQTVPNTTSNLQSYTKNEKYNFKPLIFSGLIIFLWFTISILARYYKFTISHHGAKLRPNIDHAATIAGRGTQTTRHRHRSNIA